MLQVTTEVFQHVHVNFYSGTSVTYRPGLLVGGDHQHTCGNTRGIGWFLEHMIILAPFTKRPLSLKLTGITNNESDISVNGPVTYKFTQSKRLTQFAQ